MKHLKLITEGEDFPEGALSVQLCVHGQSITEEFLHAWDLVVTQKSGYSALTPKTMKSGDHKKQAITLFFAALDLHLHHPKTHLLIHLVNPIRDLISLDMAVVDEWKKSHPAFCVDSSISFYLTESGFNVGSNDNQIHFVPEIVLKRIHREICDRAKTATQYSKASA
jgi:hypothetical protein